MDGGVDGGPDQATGSLGRGKARVLLSSVFFPSQIIFCLVQVLAALSQAFSLNFPPVFDAFLVGLTAMSFDINGQSSSQPFPAASAP